MKSEDNSRNVYALFPGIDTTPFGKLPEAGDEGWSALPEPSIATDRSRSPNTGGADPAPPGHSRIRRTAALASLAVAIIAGAGFAVAHSLFSHPARKSPAISASRGHRPSARRAASTHVRSAHPARPRSAVHRHRKHGVKKPARARHSPSTTVASASAPPSTPATPVTPSTTPSTPEYSSTASTSSHSTSTGSTSSTSSSHGTHHAGPRGRVALIGAGTTPSG